MKTPGATIASPAWRGRWDCLVAGALAAVALLAVVPSLGAQEPATQDPGVQEPQTQEGPTVQSVSVVQNQFLQTETLLFYISTKAGDRFDEFRLKEDFRRLWDTGFLDDLLLDVRDGPKGKIVNFVVRERRRIQIVDYRGSKAVTTSNIEDKLKEKEASLKIDTFYDPAKARKVEAIIKQMLDEKGLSFATVKHDAKNLGGAGVQVSFVIVEGPKAKVKEILFDGNEVFSDSKLRSQMKKIKQSGFWNLSWIGGKTTYTEEKWGEEQEHVRDFYLNHGYVTATVGQPVLNYKDGGSAKKPTKSLTLNIPVTEGDQYRIGEMKFEGLTVFKEAPIRSLFKLQPGDVYQEAKFKKAYEKLRDLYGSTGYFQWTGFTKRTPDPARKVVDLVISMEEDKRYYIGRIRFSGNETTRDKVIRREVYMNEGDVFNTEALKASIRRVNQLGYFKPMEGAPDFQPSPLGDDKLDVTFKVQEQNRNQFTFGGGVSGLEGTFINASFSTANFLGAGETLSLYAQTGRRTKNYQIAISEPYFLDRPITAGIDLFKRKITYESYGTFVGYTQGGTGVTATTGFHFHRYSQMFLSYSYEVVTIEGLTTSGTSSITTPGTPTYNPFLFGADTNRHESRVTPSFVHNTTDSPYTPRAGVKYTASVAFAGGILGGTVNYLRPDVEGIWYWPHTKRTALGIRVNGAWIAPYGDSQRLPYYQRYFLGGEQQIRGYNIRTVGPVDSIGRSLGGNKFVLGNAEYYVDIIGPLRFLLFFDAGQAYLEEENIDLSKLRTSTGAEIRFTMPVINIPFRLIYALNPHRDSFQPSSAFKFAVGTTF